MSDDIELHNWSELESEKIATRNKESATRVLQKAGITPENPAYKQYEALTQANVHNFSRFGVYDDAIENMLVETLKNPELNVEKYREVTELYRKEQIEKQKIKAPGYGEGEVASYDELMDAYKNTVRSGVEMRKENGKVYPEIFYGPSGNPDQRIVLEINPESAWNIVNDYAEKHKEIGLSFDGANFVLDEQSYSPGSFFNSRKKKIDEFLKKADQFDMTDKEMLALIKDNDFEGFLAFGQIRGKSGDKTNAALRQMLKNDKDLFKEAGVLLKQSEGKSEVFLDKLKKLSAKMEYSAKLYQKENLTGEFKKPVTEIDRVVFSARPADIAQQSTFRDWQSCMNVVSINQRYVDDTIAGGTIIAYGYNSEHPEKMVSRILINPYTSEDGQIIYRANKTTYGAVNDAFREGVNKVIEKKFNSPEANGVFRSNPALYNDGEPQVVLHNIAEEKKIDCFKVGDELDMANFSWPKGSEVVLKNNMTFKNITSWPENVDYSQVEKIILDGKCAIPEDTKLPRHIVLGNCARFNDGDEEVKFPPNGVLKQCEEVTLNNAYIGDAEVLDKLPQKITMKSGSIEDVDLSHLDKMTLEGNVRVVNITQWPKEVDFSKASKLKLNGSTILPEGVKLPKNVEFNYDAIVPDNIDLSQCERVEFHNFKKMPEGIKLPKKVCLSGSLTEGALDLSMCESVELQFMKEIPEGIKLPKDIAIGYDIPKNLDLTTFDSVTFGSDINLSADIVLPKTVILDNCSIEDNLDLSQCEKVIIDKNFIQSLDNVKLPESVVFRGYIPDGTDLSHIQNLVLEGDKIPIGDNVKFPPSDKIKISTTLLEFKDIKVFEQLKDCDLSTCRMISSGQLNLDKVVGLPQDKYMLGVRRNTPCIVIPEGGNLKEFCSFLGGGVSLENIKQSNIPIISSKELFGDKYVAKTATKSAEDATMQASEKAATKAALKSQVVKIGVRAKVAAKTAGKATKETLMAVNKAYDKTFDAVMDWGNKHAPQWMNKVEEATVQKAAEKFMKTKSGQAIAKQIEKKIGKEAAVSIAKKIPILCLGVGAACVYDRLKDGEYMKAVGEGASALVANVPGFGTLASFGLDGAMLSDDLKIFEHGVMQADPNSHMASESTFVEKMTIQEKFERKVDKAEENRKKQELQKKADEFKKKLYKYGGKSNGNFFDRS